MFVARPSDFDADVIVVGAGLGGSAVAWQLVKHGLNVLVLEAGPGETDSPGGRNGRQRVADRFGRAFGKATPADAQRISFLAQDAAGERRARPVLTMQGRGLGGSSALYAAALGRFKRSDFEGSRPGLSAEAALPNAWPIDYDSFRSYYARAEALMRVRGEPDPNDGDDNALLLPPPLLSPIAAAVRDALVRNNHHPYRLHVAIDYIAGCRECFGYRCALGCKADGYNRALKNAVETGRARIEANLTVVRIADDDDSVRVMLRDSDGHASERRARRLVLAAGALNTPLLLARSRDLWQTSGQPSMLGRGLMFHVSDSFVLHTPEVDPGPRKWLGLRDFYDDGSVDLGEIESTGGNVRTGTIMQIIRERAAERSNAPLLALAEFLRPLAWLLARRIGERPIFATITGDLPHAANHVREEDGNIVVAYTTDPLLRQRAARMRERSATPSRPTACAS